MLQRLKPGAGPAPFGWRWIGNLLLLRRRQAAAILLLSGTAYAAGLIFPISTQMAVDAIVAGRSGLPLATFGLVALIAIIVEAGVTYRRERLVIDLGIFLDRRISRRAFAHFMRVRTDGEGFRAGEAINHFQQATKIGEFALHQVPNLFFDIGAALVALGVIFYYDPVVSLALIAMGPVLALSVRKRIGEIDKTGEKHYDLVGRRQNVLSETVTGIGTVKALALEGARTGHWERITNEMLGQHRAFLELNRSFMFRARVVSRILTVVVLVVCCWRMLGGHLTVGEMLAIQLLSNRVTYPMLMAGDLVRVYKEVNIAIRQIAGFLEQPREIAAVRPALRRFGSGGITMERVSLTYPGAPRPALEDITLSLPERGVVALVGRNGSGKSTLIRILLGLRRDYTGAVTIRGHDLRNYDPRWLRGRIGVVDQDVVLFSGTVRDNLAAGRTVSESKQRDALSFAGALDFVEALPGGLDAELTESGRSLSGGQRQRLSIARAVLRDPPLVLLDEPTAFLDAEAAVALERRFTAWGRERLLILVTHHLAATRSADRILVLHDGRLVGDAPHERLMTSVPEYSTLWADYARSTQAVTA
jgi:ABC-type bacteriocin/lantibiotic exporter with double-glycine peptidase domain